MDEDIMMQNGDAEEIAAEYTAENAAEDEKAEAQENGSENEAVTETAQEAVTEAEEIIPTGEACAEEPAADHSYGDGDRLDSESFARALANPMFAVFARGRSGSVEDAVRDFERMLSAGRSALSQDDLMKMTPGAGFSTAGGFALSERQRRIARDAGMSYREYYDIIRAIPAKTK